nr:hypothetical protein [Pseudomonadota bacterium]
VLLYAGHGLACALGVRPGHHEGTARLALALLFLAFLAAHGWLAHLYWRRWRAAKEGALRFVRLAAAALAAAALGTALWTGSPVLYLGICS